MWDFWLMELYKLLKSLGISESVNRKTQSIRKQTLFYETNKAFFSSAMFLRGWLYESWEGITRQ